MLDLRRCSLWRMCIKVLRLHGKISRGLSITSWKTWQTSFPLMSRLHLFQSGFLEKHYEWISLRVFAFHRGQAVTMINNHKIAYCHRQNTNFEILVPSFPPLLRWSLFQWMKYCASYAFGLRYWIGQTFFLKFNPSICTNFRTSHPRWGEMSLRNLHCPVALDVNTFG